MLSPLEEAEEWAKIQDIMASIGSGVVRESVFMAELEQEFQQRLGEFSFIISYFLVPQCYICYFI